MWQLRWNSIGIPCDTASASYVVLFLFRTQVHSNEVQMHDRVSFMLEKLSYREATLPPQISVDE